MKTRKTRKTNRTYWKNSGPRFMMMNKTSNEQADGVQYLEINHVRRNKSVWLIDIGKYWNLTLLRLSFISLIFYFLVNNFSYPG